MMYRHGLATIALSEAYGLTGDKEIGRAAQRRGGLHSEGSKPQGWRVALQSGDPGDTCVLGWQLTALKRATRPAWTSVGMSSRMRACSWTPWPSAAARSMATSPMLDFAHDDRGRVVGPSISWLKRNSTMLTGGMKYLMNHLPEEGYSNTYYWYYATQVMHNMSGKEWATRNRKMVRTPGPYAGPQRR